MMFRAVRTKVFKDLARDLGTYFYFPGIVAPRTTGAKLLCARLLCSKMETDYKPPARLLKPITVPDRLLCGPGPSNCPPRILKAASLPLVGHLHPECLEIMDDIKAGLQYAFQTTNTLTIAVSGTGHAGMEAAMVNVVEPGDRVLVLKHGIWGIRAQDIAERCGMYPAKPCIWWDCSSWAHCKGCVFTHACLTGWPHPIPIWTPGRIFHWKNASGQLPIPFLLMCTAMMVHCNASSKIAFHIACQQSTSEMDFDRATLAAVCRLGYSIDQKEHD